MTEQRPRMYVYRGSFPLWLVVAIALPLGLVFLTSLILAATFVAGAAALATLILPRFWKRSVPGTSRDTIELDPSQYRRIERK